MILLKFWRKENTTIENEKLTLEGKKEATMLKVINPPEDNGKDCTEDSKNNGTESSFRKMPEHFNEDDTVVSEYGANQDECSIVLDNTIYFVNDDGFLTKLNDITNVDTVDNVRKANITMKAISPKTHFK